MNIRCWDELAQYGAVKVLRREYGPLYLETPEPDYQVSLTIDLEQVPPEGGACPVTAVPVDHTLTPSPWIRGQGCFHQFRCPAQEERPGCAIRASIRGTKTVGEFWIRPRTANAAPLP